MDPSSVSRAVAALEGELGTRLFQRITRHLSLIKAGSVFVERLARGGHAKRRRDCASGWWDRARRRAALQWGAGRADLLKNLIVGGGPVPVRAYIDDRAMDAREVIEVMVAV